MMSWDRRQAQRGANMVVMRPPPEHVPDQGWHRLRTHLGERVLLWHPGIDVWKDRDGQRWTAEFAGDLKWQWLSLAEPPAAATLPRARAP
jgi:hypothetical protein